MRFKRIFPTICLTTLLFLTLWFTSLGNGLAQSGRLTLAVDDSADVIVSLRVPTGHTADAQQATLAAMQTAILGELATANVTVIHQYETFPLLALTVDADGLAQLRADPRVVAIEPDLPLRPHLEDAVPATGATYLHSTFGIKGTGVPVAILDSGMQGDHSDFSISRTIGQQCFTNGDCLTAGGIFSADQGDFAEDNNGHGTNVTGIIASNGTTTIPGFAPEARIISIRVLDGSGGGRLSDLIKGLEWLIPSVGGFNLRLINLSLGAAPDALADGAGSVGLHSGPCDSFSAGFDTAITTLRGQGVILFASSGNGGSNSQIAFPACHSEVIAVGASYDSMLGRQPSSGTYSTTQATNGWADCFDATTSVTTVACFSNSNAQVKLIAPGAIITASGLMSSTSAFVGTSQAAAAATGIAALLLQVEPTLTQAQLLYAMTSTATTVTDPKNSMTFPLINARAAVESILPTVYVPILSKP